MIIYDYYFWLFYNYFWLFVIIKWLFVIILLRHVSVVCINVVPGFFCLFMIIDDYLWLFMIICDLYKWLFMIIMQLRGFLYINDCDYYGYSHYLWLFYGLWWLLLIMLF